MNPEQKSLALRDSRRGHGSFVGFRWWNSRLGMALLPSVKVFAGQTASITLEGKTVNFEYDPGSGMIN